MDGASLWAVLTYLTICGGLTSKVTPVATAKEACRVQLEDRWCVSYAILAEAGQSNVKLVKLACSGKVEINASVPQP